MEIDNGQSDNSKSPRRFYMNRLRDETGVSRTGRVLEGVLWQNGWVTVQWRPPHSSMGVYSSFEEFKLIHYDCHPSANEIVWIDRESPWHCFDCGASGMAGNFCEMCGSFSLAFAPTFVGFEATNRYGYEKEMDRLNRKMKDALSVDEYQRRNQLIGLLSETER